MRVLPQTPRGFFLAATLSKILAVLALLTNRARLGFIAWPKREEA